MLPRGLLLHLTNYGLLMCYWHRIITQIMREHPLDCFLSR